jgi:hypothetical protein
MTILVTALVVTAVVAPHLLHLERAPPVAAVAIWLSALVLRALTGILVALYVVVFVPATSVFEAVAHWCWPFLVSTLGLDGHRIGDAVTLAPLLTITASLAAASLGLFKAARAVRSWLRSSFLGRGPAGSVVVGGQRVLVASAGIARPRVVVSAGAMTVLGRDELAASLEHERGHIARGHRFVLVLAELCHGLGRVLPGTKRAVRELSFHLERDADQWALSRAHDRLALAGAICKAAGATVARPPAAALAGGSRLNERLEQLVTTNRPCHSPRRAMAGIVACLMIALAGTLTVAVPLTAAAGIKAPKAETVRHCAS